MKIVVNNFYRDILKRGIPIYTSELVLKLESKGVSVIEITCPKWALNLPSLFQNIIFVIFEQLLIPFYGLFIKSDRNIYPYNSSSLLDVLFRKSIVVVHDFISLKSGRKKLSSSYVEKSILFSSLLRSEVVFISETTRKISKRLGLFEGSKQFLLPNPFFSFEKEAVQHEILDLNYILLISGVGSNKDLGTALRYYSDSYELHSLPLKILGCGNNKSYVKDLLEKNSIPKERVEIIDFVQLSTAVKYYKQSSFVWAHSLREGYGRAIAEAKICNKNVLCTSIPSFIEQDDINVFYYNDYESFYKCLIKFRLASNVSDKLEVKEHVIFERNLDDIISSDYK